MTARSFWQIPDGDPTRLLLLRHGEVELGGKKHLYGQMDVPLTALGRLQSETTGEALRRWPIRAVYTSDLQRALYLGRQIARHHGISPCQDVRLRERKFGDWQGREWEEIEREHPELLRRYHENRMTMRVPGNSENFGDVQRRVRAFLREVLHRHAGQTIAITAHSGPLRLMLAEMMRLPLESLFTFEQDYCCLNVTAIHGDGRSRVELLNGTNHLAGLPACPR